ncbi:class II fructose-bisphosphatase [Insolitispirillum peregrinum]|uniref:Fructose-1,6-bisphosphatase n=1 Tax=Insolitispirillum peregrinum TaxID=80876 RepID=A0A1N7NP73_9PROT|nr:class II fructose-bisphosphatase [Insolitispirillum peregrinum]SIT00018.1 fructose-1,6-bisphosphatase II [Insolitispirillum peregrinum]
MPWSMDPYGLFHSDASNAAPAVGEAGKTGASRRPRAPLFTYGLRTITEAAARAASAGIEQGDKEQSDRAATAAMRAELDCLPINGMVVLGEGNREQGQSLYVGEQIGDPAAPVQFDIAVDPVEGTSYVASGMTNALAVIALAPRGAMLQPGPCFYMEKFVGPPQVKGKIDPQAPVADKLATVARETGKAVSDLTVFVLEKPRHRDLVQEIYAAGAKVLLYPAGDIAGALMAAIPDSGVDCLMGTGGTPEGIMTACAIRALGGEFMGRMNPQLNSERLAVKAAGISTTDWLPCETLVTSDKVFFCATGITTGLLLQGVERQGGSSVRTQTLMICGQSAERQILTTYHRSRPLGPLGVPPGADAASHSRA